MPQIMSMAEVAKLAGVEPHRVQYALSRGRLPEPARVNGRRAFSPKDVERVREYFLKGNIYKVRDKGGVHAS